MEKQEFTPRMYEHALMRFTNCAFKSKDKRTCRILMTERVIRMTNVRKIKAARTVALHVGERKVARYAEARIKQLS